MFNKYRVIAYTPKLLTSKADAQYLFKKLPSKTDNKYKIAKRLYKHKTKISFTEIHANLLL